MNNGAKKGAQYERNMAKELSLWVSNGERTDLFWRTAGSGAQATVYQKKHQNKFQSHCADLKCVDGTHDGAKWLANNFFIELKHYADLQLDRFLLMDKRGTLWKFWQKAEGEAQKYKKEPLIIARQNRTPDVVLLDDVLAMEFYNEHKLPQVMFEECSLVKLEDLFKIPFPVFQEGVRRFLWEC